MNIVGLILAGGGGTRLGGRDKALVGLAGWPLLAHAIARFSPQVADLALSANGAPDRFAEFGLTVLPDAGDSAGPLSGILVGLDWARGQGADALVTAAVDTPFLPCDLVPRLCLAAEAQDRPVAIAASAGRLHPTFGLWPVSCRDALADDLGQGRLRLRDVAVGLGAATADFPVTGGLDPFFNINTPADLVRGEALAAQAKA